MLNSPSRFWKQYRKRRRGLGSDHEAGLVSHCKALYEQSGVDWEPPGGATRGLESGGLQRNERGANSRLEAQLSEAEVRAALRSLKNGKSADLQGFTAELLKAGEDELVGGLVGVFNKVFEEGVFPASWNEGVLVAIFKKGYPSDYGNYRTVTVGPVLGKLYAMVLNRRITEWAEKGSVRAQGQAGFRQGFRGTDHMLALRVLTERCGRGRNRHLFACFVDFKKAFDVVPRQKLWARLSEIGLGGKVLRSVQSMYAGVRCRVRGEGWISKETFESNRGVKQGCPLSPLLFGLSTDGLEELMRSSAGDPTLKGVAVPLLSFADDVVLLSTCAEGLQKKLALLERFSEQSGLSVNLQKTQVIVFGGQLGVQRVRNEFLYAGERVEIVSSYRGMAQRGVGDQAERVHRVFLRGLLRVRKSALSKAVLGEFGRFPLVIKRWEQIFKFAKRVESLPCNRLAKLAFEESREMWAAGSGGWFAAIMEKAQELVSEGQLAGAYDVELLRERSELAYMQDLREDYGRKFCTYFECVKQGYTFEPYLDDLAHSPILFALARFRVGAHTLAIEIGSWQRIERSQRRCLVCNSDSVEDEVHFVFDCPAYDDLRAAFQFLFGDIGQDLKAFLNLQDKYHVGQFLYLSNQRRASILQGLSNR